MTPSFEQWRRDWQAMEEDADLLLAAHDLRGGRGGLEDPSLPPAEIYRRLRRVALRRSRLELGLLVVLLAGTLIVIERIVTGHLTFIWVGPLSGLSLSLGLRLTESRRRVRDLDAILEEWQSTT
ncbi:MAG: hypothetical protein AAFZ18_28835 [Myxococcota bacterium]